MRHKRDYKEDLLSDLSKDRYYGTQYLLAAKKDSKEAFFVALQDVVKAQRIARRPAKTSQKSIFDRMLLFLLPVAWLIRFTMLRKW